MTHRHDNSADSALANLSPDYTDEEISCIWEGNDFSEQHLLPEDLSQDLSAIQKLNCPLVVFAATTSM